MRVKQSNKNPVTINRDPLGNLNPDNHNVGYKIRIHIIWLATIESVYKINAN